MITQPARYMKPLSIVTPARPTPRKTALELRLDRYRRRGRAVVAFLALGGVFLLAAALPWLDVPPGVALGVVAPLGAFSGGWFIFTLCRLRG